LEQVLLEPFVPRTQSGNAELLADGDADALEEAEVLGAGEAVGVAVA
jgi:hypothetical protein